MCSLSHVKLVATWDSKMKLDISRVTDHALCCLEQQTCHCDCHCQTTSRGTSVHSQRESIHQPSAKSQKHTHKPNMAEARTSSTSQNAPTAAPRMGASKPGTAQPEQTS